MSNSGEADLTLNDIINVLRTWKWHISLAVVLATVVAAFAAYLMPKQYDATIIISPVSNSSTNGLLGGLNSVASQFGGLASLAGMSQSGDSSKAESVAVLQSETLTEEYIQQNNLLPILYSDEWDAVRGIWKTLDKNQVPTVWKANQLFKKKIRIVATESTSGLVTLKIRWTNPVQAATWANGLVKLTNDYRRSKAIQESERNIAYLTTEVAKTDVLGVKQAVYTVLQTEISKSMLARGNEEYALKVVDPAVPPEKASFPLPILWISSAFFGTLAASLALAFLQASLFRK